jgi:hypothetical protein
LKDPVAVVWLKDRRQGVKGPVPTLWQLGEGTALWWWQWRYRHMTSFENTVLWRILCSWDTQVDLPWLGALGSPEKPFWTTLRQLIVF